MDSTVGSVGGAIETFMAFDYSGQTLIALGGLLFVLALLKILKSSITVLFWLTLSVGGLGLAGFGMRHAGIDIDWPALDRAGGDWAVRLGDGALGGIDLVERAYRQMRGE